ncbi:AraC family transcriptional regulator [Lachnospiraceae bacterium]|nr:AraC family transcriptional regulator [Lachnospiraceae bacterium]
MESKKEDYINSVNLNIDTDFPYLVLDVINDKSYPRNPGFQVMHWHEDLQFIYVLSGAIEVKTLDNAFQIAAGQGVFINKNVVHFVKRAGECHYNSFIFPAHFLEFSFNSPAKAFVDSVTEIEQFQVFPFTGRTDWGEKALSILRQLSELEKNKTEFYIYEVLVLLVSLWLAIRKNITLPPEQQENIMNIRMQKFLRYIEKHYPEDLTLEDLAASANVSKTECLRCFKVSLQTTPYKYLVEYRLSKAALLLKKTDEPIGNIVSSVGFHQLSHFGKCFKEKTGYSPREYRNIEKSV